MADNSQLDAFLAENAAQEAPAAPAAPPPPESPPAGATPSATPTAPATGTSGAKAKETPEPDEDTEPPAPQLGEAVVPRRALEDERHKRQDWKERAIRAETEREAERKELMRQLEEAKRPPPAQQPQQQVYQRPIPDPATDPLGYVQYLTAKQAEAQLNHQLNTSEMLLREKIGDDQVTEYVNEFKQHAERDPTLYGKLYQQPHPYGWMTREVDRLRLLRDVGDDPAAFRSRIEAEARAKWEAEAAQRGPAIPQAAPIPGLQPSLANARSVAGRTAPQWTGETSLEDVLAPVQNRKNRNGQITRF